MMITTYSKTSFNSNIFTLIMSNYLLSLVTKSLGNLSFLFTKTAVIFKNKIKGYFLVNPTRFKPLVFFSNPIGSMVDFHGTCS